jgi:hypothetical protein
MFDPCNYTKANNQPKKLNENKEEQLPYEQWIAGCKHNENLGRDIKRDITKCNITYQDKHMKRTLRSTNLHSQRVHI